MIGYILIPMDRLWMLLGVAFHKVLGKSDEDGPMYYPPVDKLPASWTTEKTAQCPTCLNNVLASHLEGTASPIAKSRINLKGRKFIDFTSHMDASPLMFGGL